MSWHCRARTCARGCRRSTAHYWLRLMIKREKEPHNTRTHKKPSPGVQIHIETRLLCREVACALLRQNQEHRGDSGGEITTTASCAKLGPVSSQVNLLCLQAWLARKHRLFTDARRNGTSSDGTGEGKKERERELKSAECCDEMRRIDVLHEFLFRRLECTPYNCCLALSQFCSVAPLP